MLENGPVLAGCGARRAQLAELGDLRGERRRVALEHEQADLVEHGLDGACDEPVALGHACGAASTASSASACEPPITVAGVTALSVETSTKRLTSSSPATRAITRVASALSRTASTGLSSMSPTCL